MTGVKVRMRALIVDDSAFVREYLQDVLTRMDVRCAEAEDGQGALRMLERDDHFDLMVCDVAMPGMSGLECVEAARRGGMLAWTKVVMVATERDGAAVGRMVQEEMLMKPFTEQTVREKLLVFGIE